MKNITITILVKPEDEIYFLRLIQIIDSLPIENEYKWNSQDVQISKCMISNWVWINLPIEIYLKFTTSLLFNKGKFL